MIDTFQAWFELDLKLYSVEPGDTIVVYLIRGLLLYVIGLMPFLISLVFK